MALSHEMSETFNDPFVNNATPWWLSPSGQCQNNLEDGDVIEGLPNPTFPVKLNGVTWHPQTEALAVVCWGNAVESDSWRLQSRHHRADNNRMFRRIRAAPHPSKPAFIVGVKYRAGGESSPPVPFCRAELSVDGM